MEPRHYKATELAKIVTPAIGLALCVPEFLALIF